MGSMGGRAEDLARGLAGAYGRTTNKWQICEESGVRKLERGGSGGCAEKIKKKGRSRVGEKSGAVEEQADREFCNLKF